MDSARWIELEGAANVRDLAGLPTEDGRVTAANRLIRSDNLQDLTAQDVRTLVARHTVRAVADLRTKTEVEAEGPDPMTGEPEVAVHNLSLYPEAGRRTDTAPAEDAAQAVLPWQGRERAPSDQRPAPVATYLRYLDDRPDSIVETLRLIARTSGATLVHCAAGKDRTGVVVAIALAVAGVRRASIVADYAASAERIGDIFARLRTREIYAGDLAGRDAAQYGPRAETMRLVLEDIDERHGSVGAWLSGHGWTGLDTELLRSHLLGEPRS